MFKTWDDEAFDATDARSIYQLREECIEPRLENRAFVHVILDSELLGYLPDLLDDLAYYVYTRAAISTLVHFIPKILRNRGDLELVKRGDLVYLDFMHRNECSEVCSNFYFDGVNFIHILSDDLLPPLIPILSEVPANYWTGRAVTRVYFPFGALYPDVELDDVYEEGDEFYVLVIDRFGNEVKIVKKRPTGHYYDKFYFLDSLLHMYYVRNPREENVIYI